MLPNVFLKHKKALLLFNVVVMMLNVTVWKLQTKQTLRPSLISVGFPGQPHTVYDLVRRIPLHQATHEEVQGWSRSRLKPPVFTGIDLLDYVKKFKNSFADEQVSSAYSVPRIRNEEVDCKKLLAGDEEEMKMSKKMMSERPKVPIYEETYMEWTKNCSTFRSDRGYIDFPLSHEEHDFPLAFSISTFRDAEQTERLLRAIYQPQNLYCIHVDIKSPLLFHRTIKSIVDCFDNVWIASKVHKVKWGDVSVILPEMTCMKDLLRYFKGKFKYFINLTGQEFPLRTNLELVRIAKIFNGSNDITGSSSRMEMERVKFVWGHRWSKTYQQTILYNTQTLKQPYPHANLTFFKGETHGLFSAQMTEYLVESNHGRKFFEWCRDTGHASEHFWNTINYNPHLEAPGGYIGGLDVADQYSLHPAIRAKNWVHLYEDQWPCHGKIVRGICIFGVEDVVWLAKRPEMFINKFHLTFEHLGYDCLEERHRNRTASGMLGSFDRRYYENLPTVKYSRKARFEI